MEPATPNPVGSGEEVQMSRTGRTATVVTLLLGLGAVALLAGNQRGGNRPDQPNFDPGPMPVSVENEPVVQAQQSGEWTVRVVDDPSRDRTVTLSDAQVASLTMPRFVQVGVTYTFVWADGTSEAHLVVAVANRGWVQVEGESGSLKWVNTAAARVIEVSGAAP